MVECLAGERYSEVRERGGGIIVEVWKDFLKYQLAWEIRHRSIARP
jgi:hypothetical protein